MTAPRDPRSLLVAVEGIDGSGKSTLARRLADALRAEGRDAVLLREPTDGPHGRRLRALMAGGREAVAPEEELRLFEDDRREDVERNLGPALARGAVVVIDRYYLSTMAYQGALGMDPDEIRRRSEAFAPRPDVCILVDVDVETALSRIREGRGEEANLFEREAYLEAVGRIFASLDLPFIRRIDGRLPAHEVYLEARAAVDPLIRARRP